MRAWPPALWLVIAAHLLIALFGLVLAAGLSMPEHGVRVVPNGAQVVVRLPDGQRWPLGPLAPITIDAPGFGSSPARRVTMPAASLLADHAPPGSQSDVRRFYRQHDEILKIAALPGARLSATTDTTTGTTTGTGQHHAALAPRPRDLGDLSLDFWLLSLQAMVIGLIGAWIRTQAPRDLCAWLFGLSADGVVIAALSGAVFDARGLAANGTLLQTMQGLNFIGSHMSSAGLFALFLYAPRALVARHWGFVLIALAAAAGVLEGLGLLPLASFYSLQLAPTLSLPVLVLLQYRRARGDPKGRAVLRWVGATTFATGALITTGMAVPVLLGLPPFASDGMTILPLFALYGGIAFGVGGRRLFELDQWTYRLVLGGVAAMITLLLDGLLVNLLRVSQPVALAIALLAIGYLYFPLRAWLWQTITGGRPLSGEVLFRQAAIVGFIAEGPARRRAWRDLIDKVFEPLDIMPQTGPVPVPALADDGEAMLLPPLAGESALRLQFARRGTQLFGRDQLSMARELVALLTAADKARDEYTRGVNEERQRIARDLHDDVSALLLTGLHRQEVGEAHRDIQQALGEIRTMVSSLSGRTQALGTVLGDLRYETASRLASTGIVLDWPAEPDPREDQCQLGYAHHKVLTSALREMVTNTMRHSGASALSVRVRIAEDWLELVMADNGRGWTPGKPQNFLGGHGLGNVAHRLAQIGGACAILPADKGFAMRLTLPLPQ